MNILLCCSMGFSTSILVKSMREEALKMGYKDYKIASVGAEQVHMYVAKIDVILVAPQNLYDYEHVKVLAKPYDVPVFLIDRDVYGEMDGKEVLLQLNRQLNKLNREEIKMDRFTSMIESKLMPIAMKVGNNRLLTVIRNAMCATMSILIIGSICVLLTNFPIKEVSDFLSPLFPFLNSVYACTSGMLGLFTAASVAYYGAVEYKTDIFSSIIVSVSAFLLSQYTLAEGLSIDGLGSSGLITALVVGFFTVKVIELFKKKNWVISMPKGVPEAVAESFTSLIPSIIILIIIGCITLILGFNINEAMSTLMSPISTAINNPFGYAIYHMLCALVFFCGINSAVVVGVVLPFILQNGAANEAALLAGDALPFIATKSTDILIWSGGTGATIGLAFLMTFMAKSKAYKTLGRMSVAPSIFNINEPIIFGTPICFNTIFLIPFVFTPGILAFTTYVLMQLGIVATPIVSAIPWTIPPIAQGVMMSNGALSTTIWGILIVVITIVCYYPFFRMADKAEYKKEMEASEKNGELDHERNFS